MLNVHYMNDSTRNDSSSIDRNIIQSIEDFVKEKVEGNDASHDWFHVDRVRKLAKSLALKELELNKNNSMITIDFELLEISALLHDIADTKYGGSDELQCALIQGLLRELDFQQEKIQTVLNIVTSMSFRKELDQTQSFNSIELDLVRDADRLDAMGAIGIARCLIYTGAKNGLLYDPSLPPKTNMTKEEYIKHSKEAKGTAVNHFYEKLFKLKDLMRTKSGRLLAEERHEFMVQFIDTLKKEWQG